MEDILKALVSSRQQGSSSQNEDPMANLIGGLLGGTQSQGQSQSADPMAGLIGGLLGGTQSQQQSQSADPMAGLIGGLLGGQSQTPMPQGSSQQSGGLGSMMGLLETVMSGGQGNSSADPIMGLLKPFVAPLARKANISPEIAMIVVSFVAHKLLAHHPTSGRDSNSFDLDNMLQQMGSGKIDSNTLRNSGMVKELSQKTGLNEAAAAKSLEVGFGLVGKSAVGAGIISKNASSAKPKATTGRSSGMKSGAKVKK